MYCCTNCFMDNYIIEVIKDYDEVGDCDYCESEEVNIVDEDELVHYFGIVKKLYKPLMIGENMTTDDDAVDIGEQLFTIFNENWQVFDGDYESSEKLFYSLMKSYDPYDDYTQFYTKTQDDFYRRDSIELWDFLSQKLTKQNRFFPSKADQYGQEDIDEILDTTKNVFYQQARVVKKGYKLLRARIGKFEELGQLHSPPEHVISVGRANPVGIKMLYCVSDEGDRDTAIETAISEVRAPASSTVTIAEITTNKELKLVDLSDFDGIKSVFELDQDGDPVNELDKRRLTSYYVRSLSKPILEDTAQIEYISTQYLTALAEHLWFDGIMFKSSISKGLNLVIFDEKNCDFNRLYYFEVEELRYNIKKL